MKFEDRRSEEKNETTKIEALKLTMKNPSYRVEHDSVEV